MLDFTSVPVIDNHSHPFELGKATLDAGSLARVFFHGMGDIPQKGVKRARFWGGVRPHIVLPNILPNISPFVV
jgi:hypothetical protein